MSKKKKPVATDGKPTHSCLWIMVNGETTNEPERHEPDLQELTLFVGGFIEMIQIDGIQFAIVNEEGRREGLAVNEKASEIAGQQLLGNVVFIRPLNR